MYKLLKKIIPKIRRITATEKREVLYVLTVVQYIILRSISEGRIGSNRLPQDLAARSALLLLLRFNI